MPPNRVEGLLATARSLALFLADPFLGLEEVLDGHLHQLFGRRVAESGQEVVGDGLAVDRVEGVVQRPALGDGLLEETPGGRHGQQVRHALFAHRLLERTVSLQSISAPASLSERTEMSGAL